MFKTATLALITGCMFILVSISTAYHQDHKSIAGQLPGNERNKDITTMDYLKKNATQPLEQQYSLIGKLSSKCDPLESQNGSCRNLIGGNMSYPSAITVDFNGNIYVGNSIHTIQKFDKNGNLVAKWNSTGWDKKYEYDEAEFVIDSSGNIYITDNGDYSIQKYASNGKLLTSWRYDGFENCPAELDGVRYFLCLGHIAVDSSANVYVAMSYPLSNVQKFSSDGKFITKWGSEGEGNGQFSRLEGIATDSLDNVYVVDEGCNNRIQKFTSDGKLITKWGKEGVCKPTFHPPETPFQEAQISFGSAEDIAIDSRDNVYVSDSAKDQIFKFTNNGSFITRWYSELPFGIAIDLSGNTIYATDLVYDQVRIFAPAASRTYNNTAIIEGEAPFSLNDIEKVSITLERSSCYFGGCPVYSLNIDQNGTVKYFGDSFVKVHGPQVWYIPKEKVRELVSDFYKIGYFSLNDRYEYDLNSITDMPSATTSITINEIYKKSVYDYQGSSTSPEELKELEDKIDEITNTSKWVEIYRTQPDESIPS